MSRVVVTGAAGFLGRRLVPRLVAAGCHVIAADRAAPSRPDANPEWIPSDLRDPRDLLAGRRVDALIHLAWDMQRGSSRFGIQAAQVQLAAGLLDAACDAGVRRWVMMGSAEEYGRRAGKIAECDAPEGPLSPYGWAKRACGEMACARAQLAGATLAWLRPFIVYGPGQQGDMALPYALRCALAGETAEFSDAAQQRDFVFVDDVVEAIVASLNLPSGAIETLNVGSGEPVALRDVLDAVRARWGRNATFVFGARPRREGEPDEQYADVSRLGALLGWKPAVSWRQGVGRLVEQGA